MAPVSSLPPVTSADGIAPDQCSFIHNIPGCFVAGEVLEDLPLSDLSGVFYLAKADLKGRFDVEMDSVKIASAELVDWPDTSLGLPEEGMMYAHVITPSFKLTINVDDQVFVYHTSLEHAVLVGGSEEGGARPSNPDVPDETSVNSGPITILDTLNLNDCNFIHAINACFVDEKMPEGVDLDEIMGIYFPAREDPGESGARQAGVDQGTERREGGVVGLVPWETGTGQVLRPGAFGFKLTLQSGDQTYLYHTGGGTTVFVE